MAENSNINEIKKSINELGNEFEKLIISNPYLLKLTNKKADIDIQKTYKDFKIHDALRTIFFVIVGFVFCLTALGSYYIFFNYKQTSTIQENDLVYNIVKAMPIILLFLTLFVTLWTIFVNKILDKGDVTITIALAIILWILLFFSFLLKDDNTNIIFLVISPLIGYFIVILSLCFISQPLSSRILRETIIDKTKLIQDKLDALNKYLIENSHSKIEKEIENLKSTITNITNYQTNHQNCGDLLKTQTLNILNLIKLELITNSRNRINLIENWEYIDLSQNMIDKAMEDVPNSKHITMVGDLGFLSTKEGLDTLVNTIIISKFEKDFNIYFTGKEKDGQKHNGLAVIESDECKALRENFRQNYAKHKEFAKITEKINLVPMVSGAFTGIGFIGLADRNRQYNKIYSYISNLIIKSGDISIVYANPFVFSWDAKDDHFKNFVKELKTNAVVLIDGEYIEGKDILKFNNINSNNNRFRRKKNEQ